MAVKKATADITNEVNLTNQDVEDLRDAIIDGATIKATSGSASSPSLTKLGDTDTGVFFPTGNTLALSTGGSEKVRVTDNGNILVGTTQGFPSFQNIKGVDIKAGRIDSSNDGVVCEFNRISTEGQLFKIRQDGAQVGNISVTSTSTSYNTSSDYRLKENLKPMSGSIEILKQIKPVNFSWKSNSKKADGFIAHELQKVIPEAVTGTKDAIDKNGNPEYQAVDQSKIVPVLTASLQDVIGKIEMLTKRIETLENK